MRVEVSWTRTEHFSAILDVPDDVTDPVAWVQDNEDELLVDLEEINARDEFGHPTYSGTDRDVESVERVDERVG